MDEPLVELETDKVTIEVPAPAAGTLSEIIAKDGQTVAVGALLGQIAEGAGARRRRRSLRRSCCRSAEGCRSCRGDAAASAPAAAPAKTVAADTPAGAFGAQARRGERYRSSTVPGTGKDGRVTKGATG